MEIQFTILDINFIGGLNQQNVVELALARHNGEQITQTWHSYINPQKEITDFDLATVHLTEAQLANAPSFAELAPQIEQFIQGTVLTGLAIRQFYAILRHEFKRLSMRFQYKNLDLQTLLNKQTDFLTPNPNLAQICQHLNLPYHQNMNPQARVVLMARLFEDLYITPNKPIKKQQVHSDALNTKFPVNLPRKTAEELPNQTGIYYFLDQKGRIIYLGKSKNIKTRVYTHFNSDLDSLKRLQLKARIYSIQYQLTGSELIALLLESDEIKRYMPAFNMAQRRKKYRYGLFYRKNTEGYLIFYIAHLLPDSEPLQQFSTRWSALAFVANLAAQYQLNLELCGIAKVEEWMTPHFFPEDFIPPEKPNTADHNEKIRQIISWYSYPYPNLLIIDHGRTPDEVSVVMIERNKYTGFTFLPLEKIRPIIQQQILPTFQRLTILPKIRQQIKTYRDNPDIRRIIRTWLRKYEAQNTKHISIVESQNQTYLPTNDNPPSTLENISESLAYPDFNSTLLALTDNNNKEPNNPEEKPTNFDTYSNVIPNSANALPSNEENEILLILPKVIQF